MGVGALGTEQVLFAVGDSKDDVGGWANMSKYDPVRSVRVPEAIWEQVRAVGASKGVNPSQVVLMALCAYLEGVEKWEKR